MLDLEVAKMLHNLGWQCADGLLLEKNKYNTLKTDVISLLKALGWKTADEFLFKDYDGIEYFLDLSAAQEDLSGIITIFNQFNSVIWSFADNEQLSTANVNSDAWQLALSINDLVRSLGNGAWHR